MPLLQNGDFTKTADTVAALKTAIKNLNPTENKDD
jgi:hypothetical protein